MGLVNDVLDVTKDAAQKASDATVNVAGAVAQMATDVVSGSADAVTDGWITTKVKTKFFDEATLKQASIDVETANQVVTLKGSVPTTLAIGRATAIAGGTDGVKRVVTHLTVQKP